MENNEANKETQNEILENKESDIKSTEDQNMPDKDKSKEEDNKIEEVKVSETSEIKEEETKNEIKNEIKEKEKEDNKEKVIDSKDSQTKDETIDPHLIFQKELLNIIHKQEKILSSTSTINEKFGVSNEITKEQIASFKTNIEKYGKYLIMIKKELGMISSTMKKIKKLATEKDDKIQK